MNTPTQLPDTYPNEGEVYNYNGQNYEVAGEVDPTSFLCLGVQGWGSAICIKDALNEEAGEYSSDLRYVLPLDQFTLYFAPGEYDESLGPPAVSNDLPPPPVAQPTY